ncbi:hypothetical protein NT6N_15270 [Oceaniferula spumae]|uniref:Ice-binding protein C-terminal domain-containing protein n=1 Tax=Oceaniferula spumae TaxID=2979115 RepID=A0AAT9FK72_9BACT
MKPPTLLYSIAASAVLTIPTTHAAAVVLVGTGSGALVHNGTTKIDITDPDDDQVIDTAEWGTAPIVTGSIQPVGTFNGPNNNGEQWAKIFDGQNTGSVTGPWGTGRSKVCCDFTPGVTSVTMTSSTTQYSLTGYSISNGGDTPSRRPTAWRLFGSNDGFAVETVLLDTVTLADINGGAGWTAHNQTGEVVFVAPTSGFSSFRFVFDDSLDDSVENDDFQLNEIELIGTPVPEPSSFALIGLAGLGMLLRRRRA